MDIINPEILFFCGTLRFVESKLAADGMVRIGDGVFRVGNRLAVDFYHPSYWPKGYEELFNRLKDRMGCLRMKTGGKNLDMSN